MSALYRTYRPQTFAEVIGQDHLRAALENSLKNNLIGHAYLFSGPRGSGKTTMARLFAKAVNCPKRGDKAEACGKCEICLQIGGGQAVDIIEIDAASNRGIDEIRDLREKIAYAPTTAKYKVYIIDEVHMLTKEAFNALLKTLEEPPAHVIFILATTELHKVPETIISRCQRYQFHRASNEAIIGVLADIAKKEKITLDDESLELIARRAEGSFRDALTLLGNVAGQDKLTAETVRELMGLPGGELVKSLEAAILTGDVAAAQQLLAQALNDGGDVVVLVKAVTDELKEKLLDGAGSQTELSRLAATLEQLLSTLARARVSADPTALLVSRILRLALGNAPLETTPVSVPVASTVADIQKVEKPAADVPVAVDAVSEPIKVPAGGNDFWSGFLSEVKNHNHALYAVVRSAQLADLTDSKLVIAIKFRFYADRLNEIKNRRLIEKIASDVATRPLILECVVKPDLTVATENGNDLMAAVVDVFELEEAK